MKNLKNHNIKNKKILFRADLNVPVVDGIITDTSRIKAIKSSIEILTSNKNKIFLLAHFGRPNGEVIEKYSLNFILSSLKDILNLDKIYFLEKFDQESVEKKISEMQLGNLCLVENIRFLKEEEKIDLNFANKMSSLFDVYVNDAFSASHRNHTSITGFPKFLPAVAGNHMIKEIDSINSFLDNAKKPNMAIVGGSKISTKINVITNLIGKINNLIIVGAMANNFFIYKNFKVGKSLIESNTKEIIKKIYDKAAKNNCEILIPEDWVVGTSFEGEGKVKNLEQIEENEIILDIGLNTTKKIKQLIEKSNTVLWNGPAGYFENKNFLNGTMSIAETISKNTQKKSLISVLGGGDTLAAIKKSKNKLFFSHLSTAGGSFLEYLEGKDLPGIRVLK